jgi:hypothetical protein
VGIRRFRMAGCVVALAGAVSITGCDDPRARLVEHERLASQSSSAAGRQAVTDALVADFRAGRISMDLALDHAFFTIEQGRADPVYLGAILDFVERTADSIPDSAEHSAFLLIRIGRLAYQAAEASYLSGDLPAAASLMLAGPDRWQSEAYWLRYPDHDALVAVILVQTGKRNEALRRLDGRSVLRGPAEEAYARIRSNSP